MSSKGSAAAPLATAANQSCASLQLDSSVIDCARIVIRVRMHHDDVDAAVAPHNNPRRGLGSPAGCGRTTGESMVGVVSGPAAAEYGLCVPARRRV